MLRLTSKGRQVEVKFYHKLLGPSEIESLSGVYVDDGRRCTRATISTGGVLMGQGLAICNPVDNFCRATGRKKALKHCLSAIDREIRIDVWTEYEVQFGF